MPFVIVLTNSVIFFVLSFVKLVLRDGFVGRCDHCDGLAGRLQPPRQRWQQQSLAAVAAGKVFECFLLFWTFWTFPEVLDNFRTVSEQFRTFWVVLEVGLEGGASEIYHARIPVTFRSTCFGRRLSAFVKPFLF